MKLATTLLIATAATTFATQRYNPTIGAYRAWTNSSSNPVSNPSITASTTNQRIQT